MAIICKLRAYTVKETRCPSVLTSLALLVGISVLAAGAVLGVCLLAEPIEQAAGKHEAAVVARIQTAAPLPPR